MATKLRGSGPDAAGRAIRSVAVGNVSKTIDEKAAKQIGIAARANLALAPGTFSRSLTSLSRQKSKVILSGVLAVVAEYGMSGSHWREYGRPVQGSPVPPPRFGSGRPKPEDGYVVGAAYRRHRDQLEEQAADEMLKAYSISFDKHGVEKGGI